MIEYDRDLVHETCKLFINERSSASEIARRLAGEWNDFNRRDVFPAMQHALQWNLVRLHPPMNRELAAELETQFGCEEGSLHVVDLYDGSTESPLRHPPKEPEEEGKLNLWAREYVAAAGAQLAQDVFDKLPRNDPSAPIGLGLGAGRASLDFARHLSRQMQANPRATKLNLIAVSSGCPATRPQYSASSFFNLFPDNVVKERVGFFSESLVEAARFETLQGRPGLQEVFAKKAEDKIDVVVTAIGDFSDKHDLSRIAFESSSRPTPEGAIGSFQYRPFNADGPCLENKERGDWRAVTLFELREFVELAERTQKCVILLARKCGQCGMTRARALRPLLSVPTLKVWNHVVMDLATALELRSPTVAAHYDADRRRRAKLFRACDLLFNHRKAADEIAAALTHEFVADDSMAVDDGPTDEKQEIAPQQIYTLLSRAVGGDKRKKHPPIVSVNTPVEKAVADLLGERYDCAAALHVVNEDDPQTRSTLGGDAVAHETARRVLQSVVELHQRKMRPIGLGLGPGRATLAFCRYFTRRLSELPHDVGRSPKLLNLYALSAGSPAERPDYAVAGFFNLFPPEFVERSVGLFAETLVDKDELDDVKKQVGARDAFTARMKDDIDIVVTSMGDFEDVHDLFKRYLDHMHRELDKSGRKENPPLYDKKTWRGNVQYRPFTATGPVPQEQEVMRAVTLFEIDDLVAMANTRDKHVYLMARKCGVCGATRIKAMRPLLEQDSLRCWSQAVLDLSTGRDLVM